MAKKFALIITLLSWLGLNATVTAQTPQPQPNDPFWIGYYWNNRYLDGSPAVTRRDPSIDFDWGSERPMVGLDVDEFSARWVRYVQVPQARTYFFMAIFDDGVRIYIDDELVLDAWQNQSATIRTFSKNLSVGQHFFKVEYYEDEQNAVAKFSWSVDTAPTIVHWRGEYYNTIDLAGAPLLVREDQNINFHWDNESASPAPGLINPDNFSVRWTRTLNLPVGTYRFSVKTDDGARLWVNNQLVIDQWYDQAIQTHTAEVNLSGGGTPIKLEYYEHDGGAHIELSWFML